MARFYPSIYTHSVPWALHGKAVAKASFATASSLGNQIDYWVRAGQDRQTIGIPIGPDTSWLISELIVAAVESAFVKRYGATVSGHVVIDDFELGFKTLPDAERGMAALESALNEFELSLNPKKTWIQPLPQVIGSPWTESLSTFEFRPGRQGQGTDLVRYFNLAFRQAAAYPEDHVIKYAVSRLQGLRCVRENWPFYQSMLVQCALNEPGAMPFVERELRRQRARGHRIDNAMLGEMLELLITTGAPLGHSAEVAWAVWCAIVFGIQLSDRAAEELSKMLDSAVALVALHASRLGLVAGLDMTEWGKTQASDELWEQNWLLAYEANAKGWLPSLSGRDHVSADAVFATLKSRGVTFYDDSLAPARDGAGYVQLGSSGYPMAW